MLKEKAIAESFSLARRLGEKHELVLTYRDEREGVQIAKVAVARGNIDAVLRAIRAHARKHNLGDTFRITKPLTNEFRLEARTKAQPHLEGFVRGVINKR